MALRTPSEPAPVGDDRERQLAAAAWILGFVGGPIPAAVIVVVSGERSWSRRYATAAAVYWLVATGVFWTSILVASRREVTAGSWIALTTIVVSLVVTVSAAWSAARRSARELAMRDGEASRDATSHGTAHSPQRR